MTLNWGTQQDWEDSTKSNIEVVNGSFQLATAIPDSGVLDDFEDGDLTEYTGDTSLVDVVQDTNTALNGDWYAEANDEIAIVWSSSGLDNYPQPTQVFRVGTQQVSTSYVRVKWGLDADNYYFSAADRNTGEVRVGKVSNGSEDFRNTQSASVPSGWVDQEIEWNDDGTQVLTAFDDTDTEIASVSMTDDEYGKGGFGFRLRKVGDKIDYGRIVGRTQ